MHVDYFKDILVPVIGGLGIFMLGLEFMSTGIQNLAVNKMRALLARIAGTPIKGVLAGTLITGHCLIQPSTGRERIEAASTRVWFADLDDAEISAYVDTGEPLAVAAAGDVRASGAAC